MANDDVSHQMLDHVAIGLRISLILYCFVAWCRQVLRPLSLSKGQIDKCCPKGKKGHHLRER